MPRVYPHGEAKALRIVRTIAGHKFILRFAWDSRLGDIFLDGKIVDVMQVHDYDWENGKLMIRDRKQIAQEFEELLLEQGQCYIEEWRYL